MIDTFNNRPALAHAFNFGVIEIVLFYSIALGWAGWEYFKTDRLLKKSKADAAAKEAAQDLGPDAALDEASGDPGHTEGQERLYDGTSQARSNE